MDELMNQVGSVIPEKWRSFGRQLKLSESVLESIHMNNLAKSQDCFSTVFATWRRQLSSPYTWETVVRVLKSPEIKEVRIATAIKKWLEKQMATAIQD